VFIADIREINLIMKPSVNADAQMLWKKKWLDIWIF